jgi:hypothetical protein
VSYGEQKIWLFRELAMNKKQKICLWVGLAVLDLICMPRIIKILSYSAWSLSEIIFLGILVIINTGVLFVLLKDDKPELKE